MYALAVSVEPLSVEPLQMYRPSCWDRNTLVSSMVEDQLNR